MDPLHLALVIYGAAMTIALVIAVARALALSTKCKELGAANDEAHRDNRQRLHSQRSRHQEDLQRVRNQLTRQLKGLRAEARLRH